MHPTQLPLINVQPAEGPDRRADGSLEIVDLFDTVQGEGPFAGRPAVFVRTAGCNLSRSCRFCDTDYTTGRGRVDFTELAHRVGDLIPVDRRGKPALVVITGGEPLRQNVGPLVRTLLRAGHDVQIETNGTYWLPHEALPYGDHQLTIVCSPKTARVHQKLERWVDAYKYIIEAGRVSPVDGLPLESLGSPHRPARPPKLFRGRVYLQPQDDKDLDKNAANVTEALHSCRRFGYILSLQIHKQLNLA